MVAACTKPSAGDATLDPIVGPTDCVSATTVPLRSATARCVVCSGSRSTPTGTGLAALRIAAACSAARARDVSHAAFAAAGSRTAVRSSKPATSARASSAAHCAEPARPASWKWSRIWRISIVVAPDAGR